MNTQLKDLARQWNKNLIDLLHVLNSKLSRKEIIGIMNKFGPERISEMIAGSNKKNKAVQLLIFSGPSGSGKGTIQEVLFKKVSLKKQLLVNTRNPRPNEKNGVHYNFTDVNDFLSRKKKNDFLISKKVHGNYNALDKKDFYDNLKSNKKIFLEAAIQIAQELKEQKQLKNIRKAFVFVLPPSFEELARRIINRTELEKQKGGVNYQPPSFDEILQRLNRAVQELKESIGIYDYYILNKKNKAAKAAQEIINLVK